MMTKKTTRSLSISSWDFGRSVDWFCSVCALNIKQIFDISWYISLNFSYQIMRRPVDWPKALQSLSGFVKKSWRAPVRHHSTCSVIKRGCHFLLHNLYWCFIGESYILKLDEANETVLWFRKLNFNYLWDLIQKLNPIYILDLILANSQLWRSRAGSIYLGLCSLPRTNISLFSNERTNCFIFRKKRGSL